MAFTYTDAIAALLNNGSKQVLPISMSNLIEISGDKSNFGSNAQSVQDALTYLAGAFSHANTVAQTAQNNAYAYVGSEINNLDVSAVGSLTDAGHDKFISYIYQENGYIHAFAQDMTAANVAYSGDNGRATVDAELAYINKNIAENLEASEVSLKKVVTENDEEAEQDATTVTADGTTYRLKQNGKTIAQFNIAQDSFVTAGVARQATAADVTAAGANPGFVEGEWIVVLTVSPKDQSEKDIYIPVNALVDSYTSGSQTGDMVVVGVDNSTNKITATITDGTVTKAKLVQGVQDSLGLADSALQGATLNGTSIVDANKIAKLTVATGTTAGSIAVNGTDYVPKDLKTIATSGAASDVSITTNADLDAIAGYTGDTHVDDVQEALAKLAVKVKQINDGSVTSVKTNVVNTGNDAQNAVNISMTPTTATTGAVTVELTHNLGAAAALGYESKNTTNAISETFYNAIS